MYVFRMQNCVYNGLLTENILPGLYNVHADPISPPPIEAIVVDVAALAANFHFTPLIPNVLINTYIHGKYQFQISF